MNGFNCCRKNEKERQKDKNETNHHNKAGDLCRLPSKSIPNNFKRVAFVSFIHKILTMCCKSNIYTKIEKEIL